MKKMLTAWVLAGMMLTGVAARAADQGAAKAEWQETPAQKAARMKWFDDARFGLFIHWGLYAVPAGEWNGKTSYGEWFLHETKMPLSKYRAFRDQFNPVKFDADAWVKAAKNAGVKYIVITSKHHDGFCLWPTLQNRDWNITATPFRGRDPLQELAEACTKNDIRFCLYHSIMDWAHADYALRREYNDVAKDKPDMDRYVENYLKPQLQELIRAYHPGILWFDGEWEKCWTDQYGTDLEQFLRAIDPKLIINNRIGKSRAGMNGMDTKGTKALGDYGTPEQQIPANGFPKGMYWESCMTMNGHWGYNKADQNWKSATELIQKLVDCASKGGNYLLNVGPTAAGEIPAPSRELLAEMGRWMKVNGESVRETAASPFPKPFAWGRVTAKGDTLYVHVFTMPRDGSLVLPVKNKVKRVSLLASDGKLLTTSVIDGVSIILPKSLPDKHDTVIKVKLDGEPVMF